MCDDICEVLREGSGVMPYIFDYGYECTRQRMLPGTHLCTHSAGREEVGAREADERGGCRIRPSQQEAGPAAGRHGSTATQARGAPAVL